MALDEDIEKIKELNEEIEILSKKLKEPSKIFEEGEINQAKIYIKSLRSELLKVDSDLNYIAQSFKRSVQELSKQNTFLNQGKKSLRGISDISSQLLRMKYGEVDASSQDISKLIQKAAIKEDELEQSIKLLSTAENQTAEIKAQTKELNDSLDKMTAFKKGADDILGIQKEIEKSKGVKLFSGLEAITDAIPGLNKFTGAFKEASKAAKDAARQNSIEKEIVDAQNKESQEKLETQRKTDLKALKSGKDLTKEAIKRLGLEKKLVGTSKAGKPVDLSGTAAAKKAKSVVTTDMIKPLGAAKKLTAATISPLKAGFKALGPLLKKALGPLALLKELYDTIVEMDKATADLAKGMNMTYSEAVKVKGELTNMSLSSGDIMINSRGILETFSFINNQLGSNVMLSGDMLKSFTKLREAAGMTNEELMGIANLSLGTGKSMNQITGEVLAQADITATKLGVQLNEKQVLKEMKDISAATTLSLSKNPTELAKAVTTAKSLGMTLSQVEKISEGLLNFESSITSELKAELLLGKDINLEQARLFAMNNNIAGVAKEISSQIGDSADFARMNVLQQKALAEAVGMSREELAKTLFVQENLGTATGDAADKRKAILESLTNELGVEGAKRKLEKDGIENIQKQAGVQDRFNKSIEKLKEIFVVVAEAVMPILDVVMSVFQIIGPIMKILNPFLQTIGLIISLIGDAIKGVMSLFGAEVEFSSGAAYDRTYKSIEALGIEGDKSDTNPFTGQKIQDGIIDFQKGVGVTGEFGTVQLDPKDTGFFDKGKITAGTDLFKNFLPNNMITENPAIQEKIEPIINKTTINSTIQPSQAIPTNQTNPQDLSQLKEENANIRQEAKKTNKLLENLILATESNKTVKMDDDFAPLYA